MNEGDRVGVLFHTDKEHKKLRILGYGAYQGQEVPVEAVGFLADMTRTAKIKNPKILLDSGAVVYGCECWYGPEEKVKSVVEEYKAKGFEIIVVDIEEIREEYKLENEQKN